ncbi:Zinc finger protein 133 [Nymphon striatum]|nr:Zinc finger protein 133 [Nymphon striatum]
MVHQTCQILKKLTKCDLDEAKSIIISLLKDIEQLVDEKCAVTEEAENKNASFKKLKINSQPIFSLSNSRNEENKTRFVSKINEIDTDEQFSCAAKINKSFESVKLGHLNSENSFLCVDNNENNSSNENAKNGQKRVFRDECNQIDNNEKLSDVDQTNYLLKDSSPFNNFLKENLCIDESENKLKNYGKSTNTKLKIRNQVISRSSYEEENENVCLLKRELSNASLEIGSETERCFDLFTTKQDANMTVEIQPNATHEKKDINPNNCPNNFSENSSNIYKKVSSSFESQENSIEVNSYAKQTDFISNQVNKDINFVSSNLASVICDICDLALNSKEELVVHLGNAHLLKRIICKTCNVEFSCNEYVYHICSLEDEIKQQLANKYSQRKCKSCEKTFPDSRELVRHVKSEHRQARNSCLDCKDCGMKFTKHSLLANHRKNFHIKNSNLVKSENEMVLKNGITDNQNNPEEKLFKCNRCEKEFSEKKILDKHSLTHKINKCSICDESFNLKKKLIKHLFQVHNVRTPAKKNHSCDICDKVFTRPSYLNKHLRYHDGKDPVKCKFCKRKFISTNALEAHYKKREDDISCCNRNKVPLTKDCLCAHCGLCFKTILELNRHTQQLHEDAKPFQCPQCNYKCKLMTNMSRHLKTVHNSNQLKFECEKCNETFSYHSNLKEHYQHKHNVEKNFKCNLCVASFKTKNLLRRHTKTVHSSNKPYVCNLCNLYFNRSSHLKRHVDKIHNKPNKMSSKSTPLLPQPEPKSNLLVIPNSCVHDATASANNIIENENPANISKALESCVNSERPMEENKEKIPVVFKQKYTEISQEAESPLINLTPVQNNSSTFSILSSLQNYDKANDLLPSMSYGEKSVDFAPEQTPYIPENHNYMETTYTQREMSLADCIALDLQSTEHNFNSVDQNQMVYTNTSVPEENTFTALMNSDVHDSSAMFLENYLAPLNVSNQEPYQHNEYQTNPMDTQQCELPNLSVYPNQTQYTNIQMPQQSYHPEINEYPPQYLQDPVYNLQSNQQMVNCDQSSFPCSYNKYYDNI